MEMAVARNFGNLAEMYAMVIATADLGIRPAMIDSLMVSNVGANDEAWRYVDAIPDDRPCDPAVLADPDYPPPFFLHYCQRYEHTEPPPYADTKWIYSKYQVPDEILACPAGSAAVDGGAAPPRSRDKKRMKLDANGFLPEPGTDANARGSTKTKRDLFSFCVATRATNAAARDYRRWFCEEALTRA